MLILNLYRCLIANKTQTRIVYFVTTILIFSSCVKKQSAEFVVSNEQKEYTIRENGALTGLSVRFSSIESLNSVKLTITETETPVMDPTNINPIGPAVDIKLGELSATLKENATITIPIKKPIKNLPVIGYFNEQIKDWEYIGIDSYDSAQNTVSFQTNHFSVYQPIELDIGGMENLLISIDDTFKEVRPLLNNQELNDEERESLIKQLTKIKEDAYLAINEMQQNYDNCKERSTCKSKYEGFGNFVDAISAELAVEAGKEIINQGSQKILAKKSVKGILNKVVLKGVGGYTIVKTALSFANFIMFGYDVAVYGDCILCFLPNSNISTKFWRNYFIYTWTKEELETLKKNDHSTTFKEIGDNWITSLYKSKRLLHPDSCNSSSPQIEGEEWGGDSSALQYVFGELNDDGIPDAIIYVWGYRCDGGNAAGPLYQTIALSRETDYIRLDDYFNGFDFNGLVNLDRISSGKIYGTISNYAEGDAHCCPSIREEIIIDFSSKRMELSKSKSESYYFKMIKDQNFLDRIKNGNYDLVAHFNEPYFSLYVYERIMMITSNERDIKALNDVYVLDQPFHKLTDKEKELILIGRNLNNSISKIIIKNEPGSDGMSDKVYIYGIYYSGHYTGASLSKNSNQNSSPDSNLNSSTNKSIAKFTHVVYGVDRDLNDPFLNVRSSPSVSGQLIKKLPEQAKIILLESGYGNAGQWSKIQFSMNSGDIGYVNKKYITPLRN